MDSLGAVGDDSREDKVSLRCSETRGIGGLGETNRKPEVGNWKLKKT